MIDKSFNTIEKSDIDALVDGKITERGTLEYKAELPSDSDDAKREFLSDISSFANSGGGDILYGVTDERDASGRATFSQSRTGSDRKAKAILLLLAGWSSRLMLVDLQKRLPRIRNGLR
jgi:hypothetical protein